MKRLGAMVVVAAVLAMSVAAAQAGPLQQERVASTAKWVVHVDVEAAMATDLATTILKQENVAAEVAKGVKRLVDVTGCDPTKDIKAVTAYGTTFEKDHGVLIAQAKFDREKLLALVTLAGDHKETAYGAVTLHQWTDKNSKGRTLYGCMYLKDLVLLASDVDGLKLAVDVLDGKKDNLTKSDLAALLPKDKSVVVAAAKDIELPKGDDQHVPAMFQSLTSAAFSCGESDGKATFSLSVVCRDAKAAENIRTFVSGMVALVSMAGAQDENQPAECAELLKGITVGGNDKTVTLSGKWDLATLKKLFAAWQGAKAKAVAPAAPVAPPADGGI
jgi:hypothetical protein